MHTTSLSETAIKILEEKEVNDRNFLDLSQKEFEHHEMKLRLAKKLAKFARLKNTDKIPLFSLQTHEIQESNKHFKYCMAEILVRLKNYDTLVIDSLEAMRNEYVVTILHIAINIIRDSTREELSTRPEYEIINDDSTGQVDFAIKKAENLICVIEDKSE
ncbi:17926_t:CDS:2 [Funneliformis caledonium]|uniref:17926_t:CDS:1 n=1 Tax=Funneliformis caledonium TaxID=1117310 RepID=A0A9N9DY10_9GLOM|nr:17926_t:CDS:2 [Funneliformis caledonium]